VAYFLGPPCRVYARLFIVVPFNPIWQWGILIWVTGCFFSISVLTTTYFTAHKPARENRRNHRSN